MAGTIQALLLLAPRPAVTSPFFLRGQSSPLSRSLIVRRHIPSNWKRLIVSRTIRACQLPDKVGGDAGGGADVPSSENGLNWAKPYLNFASNNFLPLALVSAVTFGIANPNLGCLADKYSLSKFSTFGIFVISGLTLRSESIGAAARAWTAGIFGLCSILIFTPYLSKIILPIQLQPREFVTGLALFSCMPTTLSSAAALTNLAGGNFALALAITVISNLLGILFKLEESGRFKEIWNYVHTHYVRLSWFALVIEVPFSISKYVGNGVGVCVPTKQLFRSLVVTLLIPLILGKVVRESFKGLGDFVDQNRKLFSKINAILLSLVPWIQVSRSQSLLLMVKPQVFLMATGMGILLHTALLAFNAISIRILSTVTGGSESVFAEEENAIAVLLVTSQKTLPILVAVVEQLGGAFGESGLLVLPCVAAHLIQIIMDSFLVNFCFRKESSSASIKVV